MLVGASPKRLSKASRGTAGAGAASGLGPPGGPDQESAALLSLLICCGAYWHTAFSDADVPFFSWAVPKESPVPVIEITVPLSESIP